MRVLHHSLLTVCCSIVTSLNEAAEPLSSVRAPKCRSRAQSSTPAPHSRTHTHSTCSRPTPRPAMAYRLSKMSVDTLHQYCCPAPLYNKQLAVPAPLKECREDNSLHQFCCPPSGSSSPSR
ncbi:hypothetical protein MHYP_G00080260 [Metynnis hypsauchen]